MNKKNMILSSVLVSSALLAGAGASAQNAANKPAETSKYQYEEGFAGNFLASQYARRAGHYDDATRYLQDSYAKHPDNEEIAKQLQAMLLLGGHMEEAVALSRKILAMEEHEPVSALLLVLEEVRVGNAQQATDLLKASFKKDDSQLWLPLVTHWLEINQGKMVKPASIKNIKGASGKAALIVHYHLALINDMAGFEKAAINNFKRVAEGSENPPLRVMQALIEFYERSGKPAELRAIVENYLAQHTHFLRTDIGVNGVQDGIAEVLFTMGSIMMSAGKVQDASIYLRLSLYMKPDFPLVQLMLADTYTNLEQYETANRIYETLNQSHPLYVSAQINRAVNYHRSGRLDKAVQLLETLTKDTNHAYTAYLTKGDILRENLHYEDAISAYSNAIKLVENLDSSHWGVLFARGASHERLKQWGQAEKDLQHALKLSEEQPEVLNYLGYLWLERGKRINEAKAMIARAFAQRPNDPQIMDSMGWAYYLTGEYGKAARLLEKALTMIPSDPTINDHLGDVYWQQGRKNEARFQWERSLTFSPAPEQADAIKKKLEEGVAPPDMAGRKPPRLAEGKPAAPFISAQ